jgi:hypothetical protein
VFVHATAVEAAGLRALNEGDRVSFQLSGFLQLSCLLAAAFPVVLQLEAHPIALVEGAQTGRLDRRGVHEHVLAALVGGDEAKTFGAIEELYCSRDPHGGCIPMCVKWSRSQRAHAWPNATQFGKGHVADGGEGLTDK